MNYWFTFFDVYNNRRYFTLGHRLHFKQGPINVRRPDETTDRSRNDSLPTLSQGVHRLHFKHSPINVRRPDENRSRVSREEWWSEQRAGSLNLPGISEYRLGAGAFPKWCTPQALDGALFRLDEKVLSYILFKFSLTAATPAAFISRLPTPSPSGYVRALHFDGARIF